MDCNHDGQPEVPARPCSVAAPGASPPLDNSPETVLLSLAAEIRRLSGERPFNEELLLMEQVFVLLLDE